jgi:hypothetical protein
MYVLSITVPRLTGSNTIRDVDCRPKCEINDGRYQISSVVDDVSFGVNFNIQLIRQTKSITPRTDPRGFDTRNEVKGDDVGRGSHFQRTFASGLYHRVRICIASEHKLTID